MTELCTYADYSHTGAILKDTKVGVKEGEGEGEGGREGERERERRGSRTFTRKRGEPSNCRCVLVLTYSQSSSVHKSRPIFHPFQPFHPFEPSVLLFTADASSLSFFSLVHSPTYYPPPRAVTLVARQKGRGRDRGGRRRKEGVRPCI